MGDAGKTTIASGDLLVWEGDGWYSRLIRRFTKSRWTHVGIAWVLGARVLVIEADISKGVQIVPLGAAGYLPCWHIATGAKWNARAEALAVKVWGTEYDWSDVRRIALGLGAQEDGEYACMELAGELLRECGALPADFRPDSPAELVQWFLDRGHRIVEVPAAEP